MADLIIQSAEHFVDSPIMTFRGTTSLVVAEAYHEHYGDASSVNTLYVSDSFHDHTGFEIKRMDGWYFLTIASCDLNVDTPNIHLDTNYHLWMEEPARLPQLKIDAWSGIRINCPPAGLMLPALTLEMRAGARLSKLLPALDLAAEGHGETTMHLTGRLPDLRCSARTGIRAKATLMLPAMEISATGGAAGGIIGTLAKTLPGLVLEASGFRINTGQLVKDLPPLQIEAYGSREHSGLLSGSLPAMRLSATGYRLNEGSLQKLLPALEISAAGTASSMYLAAKLPTLVTNIIPDGQTGGAPGRVTDADRFEDFVMRYAR
jgi:hypothetical protein